MVTELLGSKGSRRSLHHRTTASQLRQPRRNSFINSAAGEALSFKGRMFTWVCLDRRPIPPDRRKIHGRYGSISQICNVYAADMHHVANIDGMRPMLQQSAGTSFPSVDGKGVSCDLGPGVARGQGIGLQGQAKKGWRGCITIEHRATVVSIVIWE